jgi:hypothetical protein
MPCHCGCSVAKMSLLQNLEYHRIANCIYFFGNDLKTNYLRNKNQIRIWIKSSNVSRISARDAIWKK